MIDTRDSLRWEASWALAVGVIAGGILLAIVPVVFLSIFGDAMILGLPAAFFLGGMLVPLLIALVIFLFAASQGQLDRRFGTGDG